MEKKQGVIIALLAVCVFFSVIIAAMYLTSDRTAPVITVDEFKMSNRIRQSRAKKCLKVMQRQSMQKTVM